MMKEEVADAKLRGQRIIYVNEAMFPTATILSSASASKGQYFIVEEKLKSAPAISVLGGVS